MALTLCYKDDKIRAKRNAPVASEHASDVSSTATPTLGKSSVKRPTSSTNHSDDIDPLTKDVDIGIPEKIAEPQDLLLDRTQKKTLTERIVEPLRNIRQRLRPRKNK